MWVCQTGLGLLLCSADRVTRAAIMRGLERGCVIQSLECSSPVTGM